MVNHVPDTSYSPRSWTLGGGPSDLLSTSTSPTFPTVSGPSCFVASTPTSNGHLGRSAGPSGGKGEMRAKEAYGSVPIQHLPNELLSHIFAHLSPSSLNAARLLKVEGGHLGRRELETRRAEWIDFAGSPDRTDVMGGKAEYRSRVLLLHRWIKSRTPALTHKPNIGPLSSMHINLPFSQAATTGSSSPRTARAVLSPVLLSLSEQLGSAAHSIPFTGKVTRGTMHATPMDNLGRPFGFAPVPVTSSGISPDGTRIVFGMADGTIRIVSCGATGRGLVAGVGERGEVRAIDNAHREGADVVALAFGRPDPRTRADVFVSVGQDGLVAVWQVSSNSNARNRMAPAIKIWSTRVDAAIRATVVNDARLGSEHPKVIAVSFDPGWSGRQSRLAAIALGLSTGAVLCWSKIDPDSRNVREPAETFSFHELDSRTTDPIVVCSEFLKYSFNDAALSLPAHVVFAHPFKHLGNLTAISFDFDEPPTSLALVHLTPREGRITGFTPNDPSTPVHEKVPTSLSKASLASLAGSTASLLEAELSHPSSDIQQSGSSSSLGRRKFVVAGDASGRVHTWNWDVNSTDAKVNPHQTTLTSNTCVTALEVTEAMVFVGSLDGRVRCYDALTRSLLRTFKDQTAPQMPACMLAAGQNDASNKKRWSASHIRASQEAVVTAIGNCVLAWRIAVDLGKKKLKGVAGVGGKMSARTERFRSGMELRSEIKESIDSLLDKSTKRVQRLTNKHHITVNFRVPFSLDNMTENEAVALAFALGGGRGVEVVY